MKSKSLVLFLVGPTASGKSALAVELARRLGGEVVSADSMLVYQGMDIGTAKMTAKERRGVRHHLIDIIPPSQEFSVFEFRRRALKCIADIARRGKLPIVAGGTGFYVRALLEGIQPQPAADPAVRAKLEGEAAEYGLPALYDRLRRLDPVRARQIDPNNKKRVIRALEILLLSGKRISSNKKKEPSLRQLGFRPVVIGLTIDRAMLYERINRRVDRMFRRGLAREVRRLTKQKISLTARQGVGYKELFEKGTVPFLGKRGLSPFQERIKQATRHLAKRQWTWFKREKGIRWVWWPEAVTARTVCGFIVANFLFRFEANTSERSGHGLRATGHEKILGSRSRVSLSADRSSCPGECSVSWPVLHGPWAGIYV